MTTAGLGGLDGASSPLPQAGRAAALRSATALTADWVATSVVSVRDARRLVLHCAYSANADGTANRAQLRLMVSAEDDPSDGSVPEVADDVWYEPTILDASATATLLSGTKETGATLTTTQPEHGVVVARPLAITLGEPSDAGTDVYRLAVQLDVTPYRWLYVACKELGDTAKPGQLGLKYSLSL